MNVQNIPLPLLFIYSVVLVLVAIWLGYKAGILKRKNQAEGEPEGPIGSLVGTIMALLAFMLAFTFGMTANRFDARKGLLLDEVNALGTAALRADLLPEPHRTECKALLVRYVGLRTDLSVSKEALADLVIESEKIQTELWSHAMALARADMNSDIGALFVESLNEVFDLHTSRVTVGGKYRIPNVIWMVLAALTFLGKISVGYQFGLAGRGSLAGSIVLALSFSAVVFLIADLDRPDGVVRVSQQPMVELHQKLLER